MALVGDGKQKAPTEAEALYKVKQCPLFDPRTCTARLATRSEASSLNDERHLLAEHRPPGQSWTRAQSQRWDSRPGRPEKSANSAAV